MLAEINERSKYVNFVHFPNAANELMANEAWGAINSSTLCFSRPNNLAVSDREELCTNADMSNVRTSGARFEGVICAFLEGHIVRVNSS